MSAGVCHMFLDNTRSDVTEHFIPFQIKGGYWQVLRVVTGHAIEGFYFNPVTPRLSYQVAIGIGGALGQLVTRILVFQKLL